MTFNCASESRWNPMRFAGTCTMYSKNAIPQLMAAATYHGFNDKILRWAYQANVINKFEIASNVTVNAMVRKESS